MAGFVVTGLCLSRRTVLHILARAPLSLARILGFAIKVLSIRLALPVFWLRSSVCLLATFLSSYYFWNLFRFLCTHSLPPLFTRVQRTASIVTLALPETVSIWAVLRCSDACRKKPHFRSPSATENRCPECGTSAKAQHSMYTPNCFFICPDYNTRGCSLGKCTAHRCDVWGCYKEHPSWATDKCQNSGRTPVLPACENMITASLKSTSCSSAGVSGPVPPSTCPRAMSLFCPSFPLS